AQGVRELRQLAERLRFLYGAELPLSPQARALEARCGALWARRQRILEQLGPEAAGVKSDLLDLALLWSDLRLRLAPAASAAQARQEALGVLADAEELFGPSHVLYHDRAAHAAALGLTETASEADRRAAAMPPRTAWEHYALGRSFLRPRPVLALPLHWGG